MDLSDLKAGSIPEVAEIRLNMQTGQTSLTLVQPGLHVDFPRVRQDLLGEDLQQTAAACRPCCDGVVISDCTICLSRSL